MNKTTQDMNNKKNGMWRTMRCAVRKGWRGAALALLLALPAAVQAQTDYSGTYYIGVYGSNSTSQYSPSSPDNNFYLCPTEDWLYYVANNQCQHTPDNGQPFLTSYPCRSAAYHFGDPADAVWIIEKAPAPNSDYYYIKQKSTGKYLVFNGKISNGGANRIRVHLETIAEPGDNALFAISRVSTNTDRNGYWLFHPKNAGAGYYLNITQGNKNSLQGQSGKNDGPTTIIGGTYANSKYVDGTIGQWNEANNTSSFYLEDVITRPTIGFNTSNLVEITDPTGTATAIYYTTDGNDPTVDENGIVTHGTSYDGAFDPADGVTTIKAISIIGGEASNVATFTPPVFCGTSHKYLIQNQSNAWSDGCHFYLIPGDVESGIMKLNTTSLFRPTMEWHFLSAVENGVQYYNIVNSNGKYLCVESGTDVQLKDYSADNDNKFKFSIESSTDGTFNIAAYGIAAGYRFLNKASGNASESSVILHSNAADANSRWKFIRSSTLDKTAPFTESVPASGSYGYYKIENVGTSGQYIVPRATYAGTSNSVSDEVKMNWYFEVAQAADASDWLTYYYIRNAITGDYLYFSDEDTKALMGSEIASGKEDHYMFTWARTATDGAYYLLPKYLKDASLNQFYALQYVSNTTLQKAQNRAAGKLAWRFESSTYHCATPTIEWSDDDNGYVITSTEVDARKWYTFDDGLTLTTTSGTAFTTPISVATLDADEVTLRAIAARNSDGSDVSSVPASLTVYRVETPAMRLTDDGKVQLTCATEDVNYYYAIVNDPSDPTVPSIPYTGPIEGAGGKYIKAIAAKGGMINSQVFVSEQVVFQCSKPIVRKTSPTTFTIACSFPTEGVHIYYTIGENHGTPADPTNESAEYSVALSFNESALPFTVKAIAYADGYTPSEIATKTITADLNLDEDDYYVIANADDFGTFSQMVNGDDYNKKYKIINDITIPNDAEQITNAFTGELKGVAKADGSLPVVSGIRHALFNSVDGGKVHDLMFDNVAIPSGGTNVGAICNEATGDSRVYNCGVLATGSTVNKDADGYDEITVCSSTLSGSGCVGGLVGLLDGTSRVINCFSYANITGGSYRGGIVGKNNVAYDPSDYKTMVMNCMFYGDITTTGSPTQIAPIYGGEMITNDGDNDGVNNFNYFRAEASYVQNTAVTKTYNCALAAETRFLQRFEFFRHILNSNRALAAWWITGDRTDTAQVMKWVLEPSQIGSTTPYPILKKWGKYPSVVNLDAANALESQPRNQGGKLGTLAVHIQKGSGGAFYSWPADSRIITHDTTLVITDKDTAHFNFNYGKVQLPYYNEIGTKNYTGNRVVTGWKIVDITGGTAGGYTTDDDVTYTAGELTATPYNFADRQHKGKDLYSGSSATDHSGRIFNQGAYWDVPEGVTAITIEPYWAKAVYLSDQYWDVTYKNGTGAGTAAGSANDAMVTPSNVTTVGGDPHSDSFNGQTVYNTMSAAIGSSALNPNASHSVYDYAVVLVGNYHHNTSIESGNKPYTVMSVDNDGDNEPDYSLMLRFNARVQFHPVRFDFLNLIGLGMAQKTTGGTGSYNFGIMQPKYWFESTNTSLFRVTQFEYDAGRNAAPTIVQGGVFEQWVGGQSAHNNNITYFHVGGNVWFKEFHRGSHQDQTWTTKHPPVSVTGGDYDEFYLTGLYRADINNYADNAECYINGGCFGTVAGAAMEGIGKRNGADNTGNITWQIQNADIHEFFAGGINDSVTGNLHTIIVGSHVDIFCGGPKFGDISTGKTVTTVATDCTFGTFFGAGYGGNSYSRQAPYNHNNIMNFPHSTSQAGNHTSWNNWLEAYYTREYNSTYGGISTQFNYQFLPMSSNVDNVARIFVEYVKFSLATTCNVTSTLTDCTVTGNFYGGGSLGKVEGNVTSTLDGCTVKGSVFGAGFSASLPPVEVDSIGFRTEPFYYTDLGTYRTGVKGVTTIYTWASGNAISINTTDHILYTTLDLSKTNLGSVSGAVTLTLKGNTVVGTFDESGNLLSGGNVYGGGDESAVNNTENPANASTSVILQGNTRVGGNVFGGGNQGSVSGNSSVTIQAPAE